MRKAQDNERLKNQEEEKKAKEKLLALISIGRNQAVSKSFLVKVLDLDERKVRDIIAELRDEFPIITNTNKGGGYYFPSDDEDGVEDAKHFIRSQISRANKCLDSIDSTKDWLRERGHDIF